MSTRTGQRALSLFMDSPPRRLRRASGAKRSGEYRWWSLECGRRGACAGLRRPALGRISAWSFQGSPEETPGANDEHRGHEGEDREDGEARKEQDAEGEDLPVDEGAEKCPPEGAEPADDHDHEGLHDDLRVHAGDDGPHGRDEGASEPAEKRGQHEHARVEGLDVDAERAQRLSVQSGRADEAPDSRALEHVPEAESDGGTEEDDEEVVVGNGRAEDADRAREARRPSDGLLLGAPDDPGDIAQDEDEGIGEEELVELLLSIEALEEEALHNSAEEGDPRGCPQGSHPEGDRARPEPLHDLVGGVRAQHVEGAVGEVEHAEDAEDERQARGDEEEKHRRGQSAERLREDEREVGHRDRPPHFLSPHFVAGPLSSRLKASPLSSNCRACGINSALVSRRWRSTRTAGSDSARTAALSPVAGEREFSIPLPSGE